MLHPDATKTPEVGPELLIIAYKNSTIFVVNTQEKNYLRCLNFKSLISQRVNGK